MATRIDVPPRQERRSSPLVVQWRVIGALILRELHTRYGRENIGYLWLILEPALLASMIALIHSRAHRITGGDIEPVALSLVGYCNFMTFRSIFGRAEGLIESSAALLYHRTIRPLDILIARALLETAGTWLSFFVLVGLAIAAGISPLPQRPLVVLVGMVAMVLLSMGGAFVICGITHENKALGRLVHPFTYIMMPLSGAFFSMEALPGPVRDIMMWSPLPHIFETLRHGWFHASKATYIDPLYLGCWILGLWLVGLLLLSVVRGRIQMP
ncbi:ABC transporter permease [Sphingomonas sp.]|jgi:capsular polysaccharide transport system permease protein|uniref:ABC transporter permease n=1 Tax=Sphingomonas sp. TaxID=28214 RepID=UPI0035C7E9D2